MAWYNGGDWSAVRVDRRGLILQQMCYAINERETAVGRTLSTWDATIGSNPAAWKLDGWRVDRAGALLQQIRDAIPSLYDTAQAERFVQSDGSNWTAALLFTAAGYGASWLTIDGEITNDVRPFLQTKAVIDELIYYRDIDVLSITNARGYDSVTATTSNAYATPQLAYDYALSHMITRDLSDWRIRYIPQYSTSTLAYGYVVTKQITFHVGFTASATPSSFVLVFEDAVSDPNGLGGPDPVPMSINGVSGFDLVRSSHGSDLVSVHVGVDVPIGSYYVKNTILGTDVTFETTPPATHPGKVNTSGHRSARFAGLDTSSGFEAVTILTLTPTYG